jgi:DNA modification methylase
LNPGILFKEMYKIEQIKNKILCGDSLEELKKFPDDCIDTIITSPPYWGLRDYQIEGQIGLEKTLKEYLEKILQITAELKRVLKPSGVMFWNHGDSYCGGHPGGSIHGEITGKRYGDRNMIPQWSKGRPQGKMGKSYKEKCLLLQNYRLILQMIDKQGWILRNIIIWHKPNNMPSSVKDRFTNTYEPVFMLVKNKRYWFDLNAVRVPLKESSLIRQRYPLQKFGTGQQGACFAKNTKVAESIILRPKFNYRVRDAEKKSKQCPQFKATEEEIESYKKTKLTSQNYEKGMISLSKREQLQKFKWIPQTKIPQNQAESFGSPRARHWRNIDPRGNDEGGPGSWRVFKEDNPNFTHPLGKNPGDLWHIPTQPFPEAHFATFPEKLVEPMILAGCPKDGIILDLFIGSGTVGIVAKRLGRNYIGIDIKPEYCEMAKKRINSIPKPLF